MIHRREIVHIMKSVGMHIRILKLIRLYQLKNQKCERNLMSKVESIKRHNTKCDFTFIGTIVTSL